MTIIKEETTAIFIKLKKTENASPKCIFCLMFYFTLVLGMIIAVEAGFVVVNGPSALTS